MISCVYNIILNFTDWGKKRKILHKSSRLKALHRNVVGTSESEGGGIVENKELSSSSTV